jgi:hypothetical protein
MTGFKPPGSRWSISIIRPEFVVPELSQDIDEIILTDLTQQRFDYIIFISIIEYITQQYGIFK